MKSVLIKLQGIILILTLIFGMTAISVPAAYAQEQSGTPTVEPKQMPTDIPTLAPTDVPTQVPTDVPTQVPTNVPTATPTPTQLPTQLPTNTPAPTVTPVPSLTPTAVVQAKSLARMVVSRSGQVIPDQYIVVYKANKKLNFSSASASDATMIQAMGGTVLYTYGAALQGYAAYLPPAALQAVRQNPQVDYVEQDALVSINDDIGAQGGDVGVETVQNSATWGLNRIDQRALPLDSLYSYNTTASNVHVYVIDTGIRITHTLFGGRATFNYNAIGDGKSDCNGHGTHVAGTIGSSTYGVAKGVKLHGVKVLDCSGNGSWSQVIAGVNWVTTNRILPAVANMSLGGGGNSSLDTAINNSIAAGVTYVVAAGNDNLNACNYSPARVPNAITVGATTSGDVRSSFSNFGTCLDIFAPGSSITSTWNSSDTATNTISGTSMASPHVAGVAALYLSANPAASPATVRNQIVYNATLNKVTSPGTGSPNRLLYSLWLGGFSSDFNNNATNWFIASGPWNYNSTSLYSTGLANTGASAYYGKTGYGNYTYEVRMKRTNNCNLCANRLIIRGNHTLSGQNMWTPSYNFQYSNNGYCSVFERVNSTTEVALKPWVKCPGVVAGANWNTLKVVVSGTSLKFYINDVLVYSGTDSSLAAGDVGLGFYRNDNADSLFVDWANLTMILSYSAGGKVAPDREIQGGDINQAPK